MIVSPNTIEAILFYKNEPMSVSELARVLGSDEKEIQAAVERLEEDLKKRGMRLSRKDDDVQLVTAAEVSDLIEKITKEELAKDLGQAGLETLAIVLYRGPVSRSEIDWIRGVNGSFTLRNLMIRGLVERILNPKDSRSFLYRPTFELMNQLGITRIEDLPDYKKILEETASSKDLTKQEG